ncbi:MAG: DUF4197 domain-containing protein [Chitinophagales bacterium]
MIRITSALLILASVTLSSCAQLSQTQSGTKTNTPATTSPSPTSSAGSKKGGLSSQSSGTTASPSTTGSATQSQIPGLSTDKIISGLKEALTLGAQKSSDKLSITDGFFKNLAVKILMPPEAKDVETKLRALGMGQMVDNAILSMNRAAEQASRDAAPIFIDAVKSMSFSDAASILTGPADAATQYLKRTTTSQLTSRFKPVIQAALNKTDATKYWTDVFSNYNKIPFVNKVNPDLTGFVTQKALDGLFVTLAGEEAKIRKDPAGTANSVIQDVFGSILKH